MLVVHPLVVFIFHNGPASRVGFEIDFKLLVAHCHHAYWVFFFAVDAVVLLELAEAQVVLLKHLFALDPAGGLLLK